MWPLSKYIEHDTNLGYSAAKRQPLEKNRDAYWKVVNSILLENNK